MYKVVFIYLYKYSILFWNLFLEFKLAIVKVFTFSSVFKNMQELKKCVIMYEKINIIIIITMVIINPEIGYELDSTHILMKQCTFSVVLKVLSG